MKDRTMGICCVIFSLLCAALAQGNRDSDWVGVWQAELDGQPSATLTLAEDTGTLQGKLVLDIISRDSGEPQIIAREPHVLMHPHVEGNMLSFQAKRIDGSAPMQFTVERTAQGAAKIHCLNCGSETPVVELTKQN